MTKRRRQYKKFITKFAKSALARRRLREAFNKYHGVIVDHYFMAETPFMRYLRNA
jgi:hypothetical protein